MSIVSTVVKRPVTVAMFTLAVMLFGLVGFSRLSVSLLPDLSYPTLTVRTDNAGAAPAEIEQLISKPIEESVGVVKGIRKVHSISKAGQSDVVIEFEWGVAMNFATQNVREKLDIIALPKDVNKPIILRFNPALDPIIRLGLSTENTHPRALKKIRTFAEQEIKRQLETISGVAAVQLGGGLQQEIQVVFDQEKAARRGITAQSIVSRIQSENINMSAGRVYDGQQEYLVRTVNQFVSLEQLGNMIVKQADGKTIYLKDIAQVIDGEKERTDITRINNNEAIELAIYKEGDANTVTVAKAVNAKLAKLEETLPEELTFTVIYDQSEFIVNAVDEVKSAALIGGLLAMLILYLFLGNFFNTIIISLAIPISIIATFNLMFANDISLNIMSLGGIALAVGLLVDNAIVVLENIARYREKGASIIDAAIKGTDEVSGAVIASTLTTLAVFFPLAFVTGFAGQLFSDQAMTVTFALLASLVVALTLIPMLASRQFSQHKQTPENENNDNSLVKEIAKTPLTKRKKTVKVMLHILGFPFLLIFNYLPLFFTKVLLLITNLITKVLSFIFKPAHSVFSFYFEKLASAYSRLLKLALKNRAVLVGLSLFFAIAVMSLLPKIAVELVPEVAKSEFTIELTLPQGTPINITDMRLKDLAATIAKDERVKHSYSLAGSGSLMMSSASKGGENWGQLLVALYSSDDLESVKAVVRAKVAQMADVNAEIAQTEMFTTERPLQIILSGYDLVALKKYSDQLIQNMSMDNQFIDLNNSLRAGQPELKISFDNERLASLELKASDIADQLVTKIAGSVASKYNLQDRQVDILVRADENSRNSAQAIRQLTVNSQQAKSLPLAAVADITESIGPNEINRIDQSRVAIISASLAYGDLSEAAAKVEELVKELYLPFNIKSRVAGQNEEMESSFSSLMMALALAVFLVYLVMASQFESLLNPFIILFSIPLAVLGSVLGLYVTGTNISVIVLIGIIMLTGIVVNNAIVLVDRINQLRHKGVDKIAAIMDASRSRFRPIIMTSLTTILGLAPLAFSSGEGSELRAPLAITVMSGLLVATMLTLLLIPVLYSLFDRKTYIVESDDLDKDGFESQQANSTSSNNIAEA
ncbi:MULTISPECIES: efflux RND transporter permease subunit [unclassified Colwellia]|uniref:efflux RND transporter permease subunit n=1 Tax=unclassified Colwellia TaxID=196834 RepID=UPI0015F660E8|nr:MULTISPECIES: efflux RND transporter permease subunit [unclassified Colwellia]MBA6232482.1 efflux RND transporter permease subunit [Colwellia sp. MB02u-7]MBA6237681.1 efflux RND transporter permease subunit [Colwellia sp. MB02u-11]MBA6255376.1 efflux RND transporter permease subunit [Colwellia sp. MB3u-28]MBA6261516.1 efflux RND transporter permease subunit [Colwellia sp. MB3u-41]MBA6299550.1 efflux RND transporter permease subunit [Colwellia sp. MB3u-22]